MKKVIKGICFVAIILLAATITVLGTGCGRDNNKFSNNHSICVDLQEK